MKRSAPSDNPRALDRRQVLVLGSASAVAALLEGCDRLVLPPDSLLQTIPAITDNEAFYLYSYARPPTFDPASWAVSVRDRGEEVARIDQALLDTLVPEQFEHTLQCIGSGPRVQSIGNAVWGGAPLAEVLDDLGVTIDPSVVEIAFRGADDYHDSFPVTDLDRPVWLVWEMNGEPLPFLHGAPARLIVPGRYGIKNAKWVTRLDLVDAPYQGYWQERGWSKDGSYKPNVFIRSPPSGYEVSQGVPVLILGMAHGGLDPVVRVEISLDGGDTYEDATIEYQPGPNIWTLWSFEWTPSRRGTYHIRTHGFTESGVRTTTPAGTDALAGYDGGMEIEVRVS